MNLNTLQSLVTYDPNTGIMFWKNRPRKFFKTDRSFKSWNKKYAGTPFVTVDGKGYLCGSFFGKRYLVHRLAWFYVYGKMPTIIDHIDGVKTNNEIDNLREVTNQENHMNRRKSSKNTSGVTGVYFNKKSKLWCAQMKFNGKTYHLGSSEDFEKAVSFRKMEETRLGFSKRHGQC